MLLPTAIPEEQLRARAPEEEGRGWRSSHGGQGLKWGTQDARLADPLEKGHTGLGSRRGSGGSAWGWTLLHAQGQVTRVQVARQRSCSNYYSRCLFR